MYYYNEQAEAFQEFDDQCPCGSELMAGECCLARRDCPCGLGLPAKDCCYAPSFIDEAEFYG